MMNKYHFQFLLSICTIVDFLLTCKNLDDNKCFMKQSNERNNLIHKIILCEEINVI